MLDAKHGNDNQDSGFFSVTAQSPTGYQKRTAQILRAAHVYSIDNFVAF